MGQASSSSARVMAACRRFLDVGGVPDILPQFFRAFGDHLARCFDLLDPGFSLAPLPHDLRVGELQVPGGIF
jgi:hypothetical protein